MHTRFLSSSRRTRRGFTLTEILIAIALIVAVVTLSVTNLIGVIGHGQEDVAKTFVNDAMQTSLLNYRTNTGSFPTTDEGLKALITQPMGKMGWKGPYVATKEISKDPWGVEYRYRFPGVKNPDGYDLWSLGPDRVEGTNDDIGNW
jgi:general secretion pathway protein G